MRMLTPHPLGKQTIPSNGINRLPKTNMWKIGEGKKILKIIEEVVDDFINIYQPISEEQLLHLSRALLHGIHTVLPPPSVTKYGSQDPILEEKLEKGKGLWEKIK